MNCRSTADLNNDGFHRKSILISKQVRPELPKLITRILRLTQNAIFVKVKRIKEKSHANLQPGAGTG
jgi:hypothetical protein